jgi:signal transduction histidine kinase
MMLQIFDFDHLLAYTTGMMLIAGIVFLFYNRLYVFREKEEQMNNRSQNKRLALILQTGNLQLWLYMPHTRHYMTLSEEGKAMTEFNPVDFSQRFNRDDFDVMQRDIFDMCDGKRRDASLRMHSHTTGDEERTYDVKISVLQRDARGNIVTLLGVQHDITEKQRKLRHANTLLMRYHTVFNSSLVDMIYYDNHGVLRDINEKACVAFNVPNREFVMDGSFLLVNNPMFENIDLERLENTRATSIIDFRNMNEDRYRLDDFKLAGKMYYESTINPIRNEAGELTGVFMAGRNVTEMVESFHHQQESSRHLQQVNKDIQSYINNINYALRMSDVWLVNYYPDTCVLELSTNINETQLRLTQVRCIRMGSPRYRKHISIALNRMDHRTTNTLALTVETELRDKQGRPMWLLFNMVPMKGEDGRVEKYFGLCRNMTEMVETEQQLAVETKKAQETELLKQSFLTNMSYEIRTPLNTVVGFAELFEAEHDVADEPIFVEEIKRNSNSLLKLVNDILYLSRLDAKMIESNKTEVDFSMVFESHCQMGWSSVSPEVKTIVDNPYERLVVVIDQENLGKVIEKLCANAVNYTEKGSIRAKYEYRHGELSISIEDTGNGIDEQTLSHVFERFARNGDHQMCGTGLDLPIAQALVHLMGGSIEMQSEVGKGTTVWVMIPCEAKTIEKRREFIV